MLKILKIAALSVGCLAINQHGVLAATAYYQPTPFPNSIVNGAHIIDGWLPSVYYGQAFQRDDSLKVGGWGDQYRTYLKFDAEGLPQAVSEASLWLMPFSTGTNSTPFAVCPITSSWSPSVTWNTQPSTPQCYGWFSSTPGTWWGLNITSWYSGWKSSPSTNNGLMFVPQTTSSNNFVFWRSSRFSSNRPQIRLIYNPPVTVPDFKMPLPGTLSWLVTTDIGGYDCAGSALDTAHTGNNYFSIDFSWQNLNSGGGQNIKYPSSSSNIPVIAAANGTVTTVVANDTFNGNYVVVTHGTTGFSSRYLHLKSFSSLAKVGSLVSQGDLLGYMGNTGQSNGTHLHFGVRYNDSGSSASNVQYLQMEAKLLKSFQTECSGSGTPYRYFLSTNRAY